MFTLHIPKPGKRARLNAMLVASTVLAGCQLPPQRHSGFMADYARLQTSEYENVRLYRAAGFDRQRYARVVLEPTRIVGDTPELKALTPDLKREILSHVDAELKQRVKVETGARPAGGGTLRVRAAIGDIETPNRALNIATTLLLGPVTRGGASLEVELVDESSGEVVVAAMCMERGHPIWDQMDAYTLLGHARLAITECMTRFEKVYASLK